MFLPEVFANGLVEKETYNPLWPDHVLNGTKEGPTRSSEPTAKAVIERPFFTNTNTNPLVLGDVIEGQKGWVACGTVMGLKVPQEISWQALANGVTHAPEDAIRLTWNPDLLRNEAFLRRRFVVLGVEDVLYGRGNNCMTSVSAVVAREMRRITSKEDESVSYRYNPSGKLIFFFQTGPHTPYYFPRRSRGYVEKLKFDKLYSNKPSRS